MTQSAREDGREPVRDDGPASGVSVVVATYDRAEEVAALLGYLADQTRPPDEIIVVGAAESHLPPVPEGAPATRLVVSEPGTCRQRNVGLDALAPDCRFVVFLDDDYVPAPDALEAIVRAFDSDPDLVGLEGVVLDDGVTRGGIAREDAERLVREDHARRTGRDAALAPGAADPVVPLHGAGLYGCNMAYRVAAVGAVRFDEALPLYGWQEDVDFAARVAERGSLARAGNFRGVHRGVSRGRSSGTRTGYSQIANPHYLFRKGTLSGRFALRLVAKNCLANHLRAFRPEPWIDRAGRVRGNWLAVRDLLRGRLHPGRILEIP